MLKSALSRQLVSEVCPAAFTYGADAGLVYGSRSRAFDQAENRLHAWKALLYLLLG